MATKPSTTVQAPEPVGIPAGYRLGVHCIDDYDQNTGANHAAAQGAPFVLMMGSKAAAVEVRQRFPGTHVIFRANVPNYVPTIDQMMGLFQIQADEPTLFYVGLNEGDQGLGTSPAQLRSRANFDRQLAARVRAANPRAVYLACSLQHGNPDFDDPEVCTAVREGYSAAYNAGELWFDLHNYTYGRRFESHPPNGAPINPALHFERRWEYLFTRCGFDPAVRHIVATEAGVEAFGSAGSGGFSWAGYSGGQFAEWLDAHRAIQVAPLVIGAQSHPSPFRFGTIFQYGANGAWSRYDVRGYLTQLRAEWGRPRAGHATAAHRSAVALLPLVAQE